MAIICKCGKIVKNERMMRHHKCDGIISVKELHSNQARDRKARKAANANDAIAMRNCS